MPHVALDRERSPHTGWTRDHWVELLGTLTSAFAAASSKGGSPARPRLPGSDGDIVHGLEGFARMSVAWGAWLGLASNGPSVPGRDGPIDVEPLVVRGLLDGTDPSGRWRWGEMGDRDQRIVEAAELATGLWLGRGPLTRGLGPDGLDQVLDWLSQVHGLDVYDDNWVLFPALVGAVERGLGRRVPDSVIDTGLDIMLDRYRGDGWYTDGPGEAFDAYTGWAIHWHMLFWSRIDGDRRPRIRTLVEQRARAYLAGTVPQFAADGSRPLFGRSLGYRFAAAAPFALAELLGLGEVRPGLARRLASATIARHLEQGALDPTTGWFLRGVGGERPEVCERYMSAGASAWAAHAFVALGLPPAAPFWVDREEPLPVEIADGQRALHGPGFLLGWRKATGETWLVNARSGHPQDMPGHDYRPYYGKLIYRSHFPFTVRDGAGNPTPDGGITFESLGAVGHRSTTERGGVGEGWAWSVYRVDVAGRQHRATTIVLPWRELEVRATGLRPGGPTRAIESPAALATDRATTVIRRSSGPARWESSATATHVVAIRALAGYDRCVAGHPESGRPHLNLVADHVEQPSVEESHPSSRPRVLATASMALAAPAGSILDLESVVVDVLDRWVIQARLADEETCTLVLARSGARAMQAGSRRVIGPSIRVVRARHDDAGFAGESIAEIEGVVRLDRPGPVSVRRLPDGSIRAVASTGFVLDADWTAAPMRTLVVEDRSGQPTTTALARPGVVPTGVVHSLQRATGRSLVEIRGRAMIGRLPDAVMYHYVRDGVARPEVGYRSLDPSRFEAQLDSLCRVGTPVGWPDLRDALEGRRALPPDAILLTFDDGLADHHRLVLPILAARGLPGIFLVLARTASDGLALGHKLHVLGAAMGSAALRQAVTERLSPVAVAHYATLQANLRAAGVTDPDDPWKRPLQRELEATADPILSGLIRERLGSEADLARDLYLDARQIRDLVEGGMALGGHGRDHPWLDFVPDARIRAELAASTGFLATFTTGPWPFAYPYGGVPRAAGRLLHEAGFVAAFTTRAGERRNRFHIGRHDGDELGPDADAISARKGRHAVAVHVRSTPEESPDA